MGILNVTPDSFSDGGLFINVDKALEQATAMYQQGATIIDVGGESTRPGAEVVCVDEELSRIVPVIEKIKQHLDIKISVDTYKAEVMQEVLSLGVDFINDVNALEAEGAIEVVKQHNCQICLMHKKGQPKSMQHKPSYQDVVAEVFQYLEQRIMACTAAGIDRQRLVIDVGFGFGKTVEHNLILIKQLAKFCQLNVPLMAAVSRKSTIGHVLERDLNQRLSGSLALATIAYLNGASIFRVHDVQQTVDALKMAQAVYSVAIDMV